MSYLYPLNDNRIIKVFISSTFQDLQEERDMLIKRTFPMLKREASSRDVVLTEKDLRWGITKEESESGNVLEICFKEIDNCIPFFIGVIGHRYGWVPTSDDISSHTKTNYTQVNDYLHRGLSATEMEIQYGVLERKERINACFFLKDEENCKDEFEVKQLKDKIINNGRYPYYFYKTPEDLGTIVYKVFFKFIHELFPVGILSSSEKELLSQNAYMHELCLNYVHTHSSYEKTLDCWLKDESAGNHMIITGEAGAGKSAFIANWTEKIIMQGEQCPYCPVFYYLGTHSTHESFSSLKEYLAAQISLAYHLEEGKASDIYSVLLQIADPRYKPLLIVLDGVDLLNGKEADDLLTWLISPPQKVKILFSVRNNSSILTYFDSKLMLEVLPLEPRERISFIETYLSFFSKKISSNLLYEISKNEICKNPFILRTLLNDLIKFGDFEHLDNRIKELVTPVTEDSFLDLIIKSYEDEYKNGYKSIVPQVLRILALSKSGFTETDIINMIDIRPIDWSAFYCSFSDFLIKNNGLLSLKPEVKNSVLRLYLSDLNTQIIIRRIIITHFCSDNTSTPHSLIEVPYQYEMLGDAESLYSFFSRIHVFYYWINNNVYELGRIWSIILHQTNHSLSDFIHSFEPIQENDRASFYESCASFLGVNKLDNNLMLSCLNKVIKSLDDKTGYDVILKKCELNLQIGNAYREMKKYKLALFSYRQNLEYERTALGQSDDFLRLIADTYVSLGGVYGDMGDYEKESDYSQKAISILTQKFGKNYLSMSIITAYNAIGDACYSLEKWDNALVYQRLALRLSIMYLGEKNMYSATGFNNVGVDYMHVGDYDNAIKYTKKGLAIRKYLMGDYHIDLAKSHRVLCEIYSKAGNFENAIFHAEEELRILQGPLFGDKELEAKCHIRLGTLYNQTKDYKKAFSYLQNALLIHIKEGWINEELAHIFELMALTCRETGHLEKVIELLTKELNVLERIGEKGKRYVETILSLALTHEKSSNYDQSLYYYLMALKEKMRIYGAESPEVADCTDKVAFVYDKKGDINKSLQFVHSALRLRQSIYGDRHYMVAVSYLNFGHYLELNGFVQDALESGYKSVEILDSLEEEHNNTLWRCYFLISTCKSKLGYYKESAVYALKSLELQIAEFGQIHPQVAQTLDSIGELYSKLANPKDAIKYSSEALRIRRAIYGEMAPDIAISLYNIAYDCFDFNEFEIAIKYGEEAIIVANKNSQHQLKALALLLVGKAYIQTERIQDAIGSLNRAEKLFISINDLSHSTEARELLKSII